MKTPRKLSLKHVCKEKKIFYSGHSFSENIELATKHMQEIADSSELSLREKLTYITYFSVLCHLLSPEHFFPIFLILGLTTLKIYFLFSLFPCHPYRVKQTTKNGLIITLNCAKYCMNSVCDIA